MGGSHSLYQVHILIFQPFQVMCERPRPAGSLARGLPFGSRPPAPPAASRRSGLRFARPFETALVTSLVDEVINYRSKRRDKHQLHRLG